MLVKELLELLVEKPNHPTLIGICDSEIAEHVYVKECISKYGERKVKSFSPANIDKLNIHNLNIIIAKVNKGDNA